MSTQQPELDPVAIRGALVLHRNAGLQYEEAWQKATNYHRSTPDDRSVYRFMKAHFRAAYYNDDTPKGRCLVPECDVSNALLFARRRLTGLPVDSERCRSGDGCDRLATHGRFGKVFCERHATELEQIRLRMFSTGRTFGRGRAATRAAA